MLTSKVNALISAAKTGQNIYWAGHRVTVENITWDWETPEFRINLEYGGSYKAGGREIRGMQIMEQSEGI